MLKQALLDGSIVGYSRACDVTTAEASELHGASFQQHSWREAYQQLQTLLQLVWRHASGMLRLQCCMRRLVNIASRLHHIKVGSDQPQAEVSG